MVELTQKQQVVLDFIRDYQREQGSPPTRMEIAAHFGFRSPNAAEDHLKMLEKKGVLTIVRGSARGIRLADEQFAEAVDEPPFGLPLLGQVAAGSPILASENIDRYCPMAADVFTPSADYLLVVKGDSMINIGLWENDWVAVHKTQQVKNGDIVVARLQDEVTVKRWQKLRDKILLCPENEAYQPIVIKKGDTGLMVEGLVVGLIRRGL